MELQKSFEQQKSFDVTCPSQQEPFDYVVKTIIIGDAGVGKTSILRQFTESIFSSTRESTIGIDFGNRKLQIQDPKAKKILVTPNVSSQNNRPDGLHKLIKNPTYNFQIWDCAGQERFRSIVASYLRGAKFVLLAYDITDRDSFDHLQDWIKDVKSHLGVIVDESYVLVVVGNKKDLEDQRRVHKCEAESFTQMLTTNSDAKVPYFEISAKDASSVHSVFQYATQEVYKRHLEGKMYFQHRTYLGEAQTLDDQDAGTLDMARCLPPIPDCTVL